MALLFYLPGMARDKSPANRLGGALNIIKTFVHAALTIA
jgi:hypothetical protein